MIAAGNGALASVNELHNTHRDEKLLDQFRIYDYRRDIVRSELWRHAIRLVGFIAFLLVALGMLVFIDMSQEVSAARMVIRFLLLFGLLAMTLVAYLDRRARKRLVESITRGE